jgi:hypothetical protein
VLGVLLLWGGSAGATGTGWGGEGSDLVLRSTDGALEFFDFRFVGIHEDDVTIDVTDRDITFSGDESVHFIGLEHFQIQYSVRALGGLELIGTSLALDSEVDVKFGLGGVIAKKEIKAPRAPEPHPYPGEGSKEGADGLGARLESWGGGYEKPAFDHFGKLLAYNISGGWVCGCGHHHSSLSDVESECAIEQATDEIAYDPEPELRIKDSINLFALGAASATWNAVTNSYVLTPEPGSAALMAMGLVGLVLAGRRQR